MRWFHYGERKDKEASTGTIRELNHSSLGTLKCNLVVVFDGINRN